MAHRTTADLGSVVARENAADEILAGIRVTDSIIRNRKRTVGGFTKRRAQTLKLKMSAEEASAYEALNSYLAKGYAAAASTNNRILGFEMVAFQRMFASSGRAAAISLGNRLNRLRKQNARISEVEDTADEPSQTSDPAFGDPNAEIHALEQLVPILESAPDAKIENLVRLVETLLSANPREKILVFTQYYGTQQLVASRLAAFDVVSFNGRLDRTEKDRVVDHFRRRGQTRRLITRPRKMDRRSSSSSASCGPPSRSAAPPG